MVMLFIADQQVQMRLGVAGDVFGALEGEAFHQVGLDDDQQAVDAVHDRCLHRL